MADPIIISAGACTMRFTVEHARSAVAVLLHWSGLLGFHTAAKLVIQDYGGVGWAKDVLSRLSACRA